MAEKRKTMTVEELMRAQGMLIKSREAEELEARESEQRYIIDKQQRRKQGLDTVGNRMMARLSKNYAFKTQNKLREADSIISNSQRILQDIEKRRREDEEIRHRLKKDARWSEVERMRRSWDSERISAKLLGEHQRKLAEIQREQQRAKEAGEKAENMRKELRMNRLRRRR